MKRILIVSLFILPLTACSFGKKTTPTLRMRPPAVLRKLRKRNLQRSDLIVAHWAGNTWSEGKVDSVNGPRREDCWTTTLHRAKSISSTFIRCPKRARRLP